MFFANSRLWLGGNLWCRLRKLAAFEDSKMACSNRQCFGCEKDFFSAYARQLGEERLLGYKKTAFSVRAKPTDKEKLFINPPWQHFSTVPKLTCNSPFQISSATVSLQYNIPFSKLRSLALAVRLPFRTDSNPHRRYPERLSYPAQPVT